MIYIVETSNQTVVRNNYDIIEASASNVDKLTILNDESYLKEKFAKNSVIIVGSLFHAFRLLFLKKRKKICVWVQGVLPEESYLRKKSKLRYLIANFIEKYALKRVAFLMFASNEMKKHYERKYNLSFNNYIVFPCFNTEMKPDCFSSSEKYINNIFVYAGGTAKWQNLDAIVKAYSFVEPILQNSKFLFLVNDKEYALSLILKYNVRNYEIKYVSKEQLPYELAKAKFGFVLREDNVINRVSTPTKLSTYLSCGVIPIFSSCIGDFFNLTKDKEFKIVYDKCNFLDELLRFKFVDNNKIKSEYQTIFNEYYSNSFYIDIISERLKRIL